MLTKGHVHLKMAPFGIFHIFQCDILVLQEQFKQLAQTDKHKKTWIKNKWSMA